MRWFVLLVALPLGILRAPASLAGTRPKQAANSGPNQLSAEERKKGWVLVYDGKSTSGWKVEGDAVSRDGMLVVGGAKPARISTVAKFGNPVNANTPLSIVRVRFEFRWKGKDE